MTDQALQRQNERFLEALKEEAGAGTPPAGLSVVRPGMVEAVSKAAPLTALREGQVHLGDATHGGPLGLDLSHLIKGRLLIQGNSGAGKSMLLRRLFEEAFGKVQQLVIDADGEFSTLADCFDVAVLTAADVLRVGGEAFAAHLRQHRYSAVLDISDATDEDRLAVTADVAAGLIGVPEDLWRPMLVLVDEAQSLAPHYDTGGVSAETRRRAIAALADLMGRGRKRGLAGVIATQRLAETAKAVAAKASNIIVGRTFLDRDLERAGGLLGFTAGHARALRTLEDGEFICLGPALAGARRVRFRARPPVTRHKGAAPSLDAPPEISAADAVASLGNVPDAAPSVQDAPAAAVGRGRKKASWCEGEEEIIRDGYARAVTIVDICAALRKAGYRHRSPSALTQRARLLGCRSKRATVQWSEDEDEILRAAYREKLKWTDTVNRLAACGYSRSRQSIQMRAIHLGLTRDRVNYWTEEEKTIAIAGLEAGKPYREINQDLKAAGYERGQTAMFKFAQKHGYNRAPEPWTAEEIEILRQRYEAKIPVREIAEELGKTLAAVRAVASKNGFKQRLPWSAEERQILSDFHARGGSLTAAAARIGRPYTNVAAEAARQGLHFRKHADAGQGDES